MQGIKRLDEVLRIVGVFCVSGCFLYSDLTNNAEACWFSFSSLSSLGRVAASRIAKHTLYLRRNNFQKFGGEGVRRTEELIFKTLVCFWHFWHLA